MSDVADPNISALPLPSAEEVPEGVRRLWEKSRAAFGFVPNVFVAQAYNGEQFQAWWNYFNLLVNKEGYLSNAERELLAVVVSGLNRCTYCAVSHGAALRHYSGDPVAADMVAVNWRQADLTRRQAALAAYAEKLTLTPADVTPADLAVTPLLATTIGAAAGAIVNFFLQHRVVFATKASYLKTATPYGLSLMLGFALNALCFVLLMQLNVFPLGLVQVLSSACVTVFNFIFYKKVVFYGSQTTHSA